ncbi:NAD-dependent epimerase/dehydratase family protein [Thermodesulfobacteriota bacterium]
MKISKLNCWDVKNCGRGPDAVLADEEKCCPAAREQRLDGVHGGMNSGRACWVVAGTFCGGQVQGTFARKYDVCRKCEFFQRVATEEGAKFHRPVILLSRLKSPSRRIDVATKKLGVLIGGSGLIGGALMHYFKTRDSKDVDVLSPNSKKLSLRVPEDIKQYFNKYRPDFIINTAIAAIDSDAQLAFETNYLGSVNLAKVAMALKIPYIHFSSAATLPMGHNLTEEDELELVPGLPNYAKSKLMTEKTLQHFHETKGLDYTTIRLGVVYGRHDHKIQGFHRMLFSIADQAMPFLLTKRGIMHSYSNTKKLPNFIHYLIENREEFSGQTYHFVDNNSVKLDQLILTIRNYLELKIPRELYIPYSLARMGKTLFDSMARFLSRIGIESRLPAEIMFMENFYQSQSLSSEKLRTSSYGDPDPETTVFSELPSIIEYYLTRWEHLNLISHYKIGTKKIHHGKEQFQHHPEILLHSIHDGKVDPFADFEELRE